MPRVALFIEDLVDEREFMYPFFRFLEEGFEVDVIGKEKRLYSGKRGFRGRPLEATKTLEEASKEEYDIAFIPGGYAPDRLRTYKEVIEIVRKAKILAAICHGPWVLISAKLIKPNARVAAYKSLKDDIENAGGIYSTEVSYYEYEGKHIFTAVDPRHLPELLKRVIEKARSL